jgi:hypothetical protein
MTTIIRRDNPAAGHSLAALAGRAGFSERADPRAGGDATWIATTARAIAVSPVCPPTHRGLWVSPPRIQPAAVNP